MGECWKLRIQFPGARWGSQSCLPLLPRESGKCLAFPALRQRQLRSCPPKTETQTCGGRAGAGSLWQSPLGGLLSGNQARGPEPAHTSPSAPGPPPRGLAPPAGRGRPAPKSGLHLRALTPRPRAVGALGPTPLPLRNLPFVSITPLLPPSFFFLDSGKPSSVSPEAHRLPPTRWPVPDHGESACPRRSRPGRLRRLGVAGTRGDCRRVRGAAGGPLRTAGEPRGAPGGGAGPPTPNFSGGAPG